MIFEIMEMGMTGANFNPKIGQSTLFNNSYSSIVGSVLAFYIGMGRITNVFGTETKIVVDPESMTGFGFMKLPTFMKSFIGGGDSGFVLGATNKLLYAGCDFEVKRARTKIEWLKAGAGDANIPSPIKLLIALGVLSVLGAALLLRFEYGVTSSTGDPSPTLQLASAIIPLTEGAWMSCLMLLEYLCTCAESAEANKKSLAVKITAKKEELHNTEEQYDEFLLIDEDSWDAVVVLSLAMSKQKDELKTLEDELLFNERVLFFKLSLWLASKPK